MLYSSDFICSTPSLIEYLKESGFDTKTAHIEDLIEHPFSLLIPKYYADLIDWRDSDDPLRKMILPDKLEHEVKDYELADPIGDAVCSPTPGVVHRYPDRCLLMLTNVCAVHCRFCFRKNILDTNGAHLDKALAYIRAHIEIWEVIFSGGDPFMFTDHFMESIVSKLRRIPHVKMIRFHTRTPVVYPQKITPNLLASLQNAGPCSVVLHVNHPREITPAFIAVVSKMRTAGALVLSQTVLLKGVNDHEKILGELFKKLVESGVKPYYLHHLDFTKGTHHFRISVARGKEIMQKLRGTISGLCMPEYVIDTPGGYGKIPAFWFNQIAKHTYEAVGFEGQNIIYKDTG